MHMKRWHTPGSLYAHTLTSLATHPVGITLRRTDAEQNQRLTNQMMRGQPDVHACLWEIRGERGGFEGEWPHCRAAG